MRKALGMALTLVATGAFAQEPDWAKITFEVQKVAGSVYMLTGVGEGAGGNIGVSLGEDGILLVDDQFAPLVPKIEAALQEAAGAGRPAPAAWELRLAEAEGQELAAEDALLALLVVEWGVGVACGNWVYLAVLTPEGTEPPYALVVYERGSVVDLG